MHDVYLGVWQMLSQILRCTLSLFFLGGMGEASLGTQSPSTFVIIFEVITITFRFNSLVIPLAAARDFILWQKKAVLLVRQAVN